MNIYSEIIRIFTKDANFLKKDLIKHYNKRRNDGDIPATMTQEEYDKLCTATSTMSVNGTTVKGYKYGSRIAKWDTRSNFYVSFAGGTLITGFPLRGGKSRFYTLMERDGGTEFTQQSSKRK